MSAKFIWLLVAIIRVMGFKKSYAEDFYEKSFKKSKKIRQTMKKFAYINLGFEPNFYTY